MEPYAVLKVSDDPLVPEFEIEEHEGPMVCCMCEEEPEFLLLVGAGEERKDHCIPCAKVASPEHAEAIELLQQLLFLMMEEAESHMTQDEWHELYGRPRNQEG